MKIAVFGPGPKFKGGIANYTLSLAKELDKRDNVAVDIISWTHQYPSIIPRDFINRSIISDPLEGTKVKVSYVTNFNNPFSWHRTADLINKIAPDILIIQWALAIQGLPINTILRKVKASTKCEIIFVLHVVKQKEESSLDSFLIKLALRHADSYIAHAQKYCDELKQIFPGQKFFMDASGKRALAPQEKTVIKLFHPVYDMFAPDLSFDKEKFKTDLGLKKNVFLFFGFIRRYKGLHNVIRAFGKLAAERDDVSLLIVGESFWNTLDGNKLATKIKKSLFGAVKKIILKQREDESDYRPLDLIRELNLKGKVVAVNSYVPNEDVHKYFQASDCNVLFYLVATPSGVESTAYNFSLPSIATRVGHFSESITDGYNGYLAEPDDIDSMYLAMKKFIEHPIPKELITETAGNLSWERYVNAVLNR
ncbi:MAG: glycosyltransferase [Melioribacteraceae bacterium]